jgi:pimeloyl-ACP methyl ester carboxylesterase
MSAPIERTVTVNGHACRVLEKGSGPTVGYLAGLVGLPAWTPFLDELSRTHRVVVPSLPGFPGATGHEDLDHLIDWVAATLDLIEGAGLSGADLIGASLGGCLAAEVAALSPGSVGRLVLMAPLGLYDEAAPVSHLWAKKSGELNLELCEAQDVLQPMLAVPEGADPTDWKIEMSRAAAAGARLLWPMCDLGLVKRLRRITAPTLILWGERDRILDPGVYPDRFASGISGPVNRTMLAEAGHLLDLDQPAQAAAAVRDFLAEGREQQAA